MYIIVVVKIYDILSPNKGFLREMMYSTSVYFSPTTLISSCLLPRLLS